MRTLILFGESTILEVPTFSLALYNKYGHKLLKNTAYYLQPPFLHADMHSNTHKMDTARVRTVREFTVVINFTMKFIQGALIQGAPQTPADLLPRQIPMHGRQSVPFQATDD